MMLGGIQFTDIFSCILKSEFTLDEHVHEKTNNLGSDQV